jgi:hypothetical protein
MTLWRGSLILLVILTAAVVNTPAQRGAGDPAVIARTVTAANAFLAALDAPKRAKANVDLNAKTRTIWSNLPTGTTMQVGARDRNGLKLGDMAPAEEQAALALLAATLSADGLTKVMNIVNADQALEVTSAPTRKPGAAIRFGRAEFYLAILGTPSTTAPWMLQFGGHHLAINVTFAASQPVLAPTLTGAQPARFEMAGRTIRPLGDEADKAFALMKALNPEQQKQATLGVEVRNLVLPPGADGQSIAPEGARVATFTAAQRAMLVDLAREWIGIVDDATAAAKMKQLEASLADTYFAWAGPIGEGQGAYFRIHSPVAFIEYAPQGAAPNNVDHIHTIYREPGNDYASGLTK